MNEDRATSARTLGSLVDHVVGSAGPWVRKAANASMARPTDKGALRAAVFAYCNATGMKGALAMLAHLLDDGADEETLKRVFRIVAADDPVTLAAFNALRS